MKACAMRRYRRVAALVMGAMLAVLVSPDIGEAQGEPQFVIIVHPSNTVVELKRGEVRDLFLRRRVVWSGSARVDPVDLAPKLPVRSQFSREVLALSTTAVTNYWMQEIFGGGKTPPPVMSTAAAAVAYVAVTPGAVAYVPRDTPLDRVRTVRIVP